MEKDMDKSIQTFLNRLEKILDIHLQSVYLYGSVTLDDFKLGWSDIDILCLTKETLTQDLAEKLLCIRQDLQKEEPKNPFYGSFEGVICSSEEFLTQQFKKVVYWGTGKERITSQYDFDVFSMYTWIKYGKLIKGSELRHLFQLPTQEDLQAGVRNHYETIRKYAVTTSDNIHACGWLLDIARSLYTLSNNDIIAKTKAGEWAYEKGLCPVEKDLKMSLKVRNNPTYYKNKPDMKEWFASLGESVQIFADVLEKELTLGS